MDQESSGRKKKSHLWVNRYKLSNLAYLFGSDMEFETLGDLFVDLVASHLVILVLTVPS